MADRKRIEVHNAWTIEPNDEGPEDADPYFAQLGRPQDWGDPRWKYEQFTLIWHTPDKDYVNHVHCWTTAQIERSRIPELFSSLIVQILMPGLDPRECGKTHLKSDDFWYKAWGKRPPEIDYEASGAWDWREHIEQ